MELILKMEASISSIKLQHPRISRIKIYRIYENNMITVKYCSLEDPYFKKVPVVNKTVAQRQWLKNHRIRGYPIQY